MLVQSGEARDGGADRRLAWSLAGIAGALNAAGFYAVGVFSSNMTGNVSSLADHLALADLAAAAPYLGLVATFVAGAAVSAVLINAGRRRGMARIYALSILAEAALLTGLASADLWLTGGRAALLAYGLSFLMGLQNAVVTRISNARVRTTHVTGMVTDIGIELGNLLDLALLNRASRRRGPDGRDAEAEYNADKLLLHGVTVLSFLAGGVFGVLAYRRLGALFLFGAAMLLFLLALPGLVRKETSPLPRPKPG
ncbi:MAG: YoaK family protein [Janthinobacterium lividum]